MPTITDWITAISGAITGAGILLAVLVYFLSRRHLAVSQLQMALDMRRRWEEGFVDFQRGLAVMTWFVFPEENFGVPPFLPSDEEWNAARETAFTLAYHASGKFAEFEAATRRLYNFLYELASLRTARLLSITLLYTFFGRDLLRHWSPIRGFVLHWPPSANFPQQRHAIERLLLDLHEERKRRGDIDPETLRLIEAGQPLAPPDVNELLQRSERFKQLGQAESGGSDHK